MELKARLNKPYTDNQKMDFIVKQNHQNGYEIKETDVALEAWGNTADELEEQEKERIAKLFLTGADVERGIYQAKGMDFEDIIECVSRCQNGEALSFGVGTMQATCDAVAQELCQDIDIKALKIELKANNFYRGNPYVSAIGALLGFTDEQLDLFFETKDYTVLLPKEEPTEILIDPQESQATGEVEPTDDPRLTQEEVFNLDDDTTD